MGKKLIFITLGLALVIFAGFKLADNKSEINEAATFKEEIGNIPVNIITVNPESHPQEYRFTGTFQPAREVNFGAELQGQIIKTYVKEGDYLSPGKPIAKIDDSMLKLQLESQKNQLALTEVNLNNQKAVVAKTGTDMERFENLKKDEAVADITYQNQKLNYTQVKGGLAAQELSKKGVDIAIQTTQKQLDKTIIKAPISGYLTKKQFEVGSIVAPGVPMGMITDISNLKLVTMVPEKQIVEFSTGQEVEVQADVFPGIIYKGIITQIGAKGDQNHNFKVEVSIKNQDKEHRLRASMYGDLKITSKNLVESIFVPVTVLVGTGNKIQVYVVEDGKAVLRNVKTGISIDDKIEITSGLKKGDQIVVSGINRLNNGLTVNIVK